MIIPFVSFSASTASSTHGVIIATSSVAAANRNNILSQQAAQRANIAFNTEKVTGVMTCRGDYRAISGKRAWDIFSCSGYESINIFFKKNRASKKDEILNVVYNDHENTFIIYYGKKTELTE
jgi:cyanophycinase-like exopeptidase